MNAAQTLDNRDKISWVTRIAYGLGDTAQNIVWGVMSILPFFYTDYAGIAPAMVGEVMLFSQCFDGFSDIIMGFFVEKTHSKWWQISTVGAVGFNSICAFNRAMTLT